MPKNSERKIVFLNTGGAADTPIIWEHNLQLNGSWRNWFTCVEPLGMKCPACAYAA